MQNPCLADSCSACTVQERLEAAKAEIEECTVMNEQVGHVAVSHPVFCLPSLCKLCFCETALFIVFPGPFMCSAWKFVKRRRKKVGSRGILTALWWLFMGLFFFANICWANHYVSSSTMLCFQSIFYIAHHRQVPIKKANGLFQVTQAIYLHYVKSFRA